MMHEQQHMQFVLHFRVPTHRLPRKTQFLPETIVSRQVIRADSKFNCNCV